MVDKAQTSYTPVLQQYYNMVYDNISFYIKNDILTIKLVFFFQTDCFERVAIGKRLNSSDVTKIISTTNIKQCSNECERILCNTYSYGWVYINIAYFFFTQIIGDIQSASAVL